MTHIESASHGPRLSDSSLSGSSLPALITALGQDGFGHALLAFLHAAACVDMISAFSLCPPGPPRLRLATGAPLLDNGFAQAASLQYARDFWQDDPALPWMLGAGQSAGNAVPRQPWSAIPRGSYRSICYEQPLVLERVSVYGRPDGMPILVNLYRRQSTGPFTPSDINWIDGNAELLTALAARHAAQIEAASRPPLHPDPGIIASGLRARAPQLSAREAEICAALLVGDPVKEVARSTRLEVSTVVTYKKRAYVKLGIATRHDLARMYATLGTPHN